MSRLAEGSEFDHCSHRLRNARRGPLRARKGEDGALKTRGLEAADQFGPRAAGTYFLARSPIRRFCSFLNVDGRPPRLTQLGGAQEDVPEYKREVSGVME